MSQPLPDAEKGIRAAVVPTAAALGGVVHLDLGETLVSDDGLTTLGSLERLQSVGLRGAKSVTKAGIARLKALKPGLEVSD